MRFRRLAGALLALGLVAGCRAEPQLRPAPALWEVTGDEGEHAFIFGTVHALPSGYEWATPTLSTAFAASKELLVEIGPDKSGIPAIFDRLGRSSGLPPLSHRLPMADRAALERAMKAKGPDNEDFAGLESWAAAIVLSQAYDEGGNGVDTALLKGAKGKRIVELEGAENQLRIFDRLPETDQRDLLAAIAREALEGDGPADARLQNWLRGDQMALAKDSRTGLLADPELREALLVSRNKAWAAKIAKRMAGGDTLFVAVGALHTVGPDGLAALLEAEGYTVERIQ